MSLTLFDHDIKEERLVKMPDEETPDKSDSVRFMKRIQFPISVSERILEETSNVLECSPLLSHVSRLSSSHHELVEVTICLLGKGSVGMRLRDGKRKSTCQSCQHVH